MTKAIWEAIVEVKLHLAANNAVDARIAAIRMTGGRRVAKIKELRQIGKLSAQAIEANLEPIEKERLCCKFCDKLQAEVKEDACPEYDEESDSASHKQFSYGQHNWSGRRRDVTGYTVESVHKAFLETLNHHKSKRGDK